jgi:adenylate cyclase
VLPLQQGGQRQGRQVWQEGLAKFPDSALLRIKLAWTYVQDIINEWTNDSWGDTEQAWKLAKEAEAIPNKSRLETFLYRWLMANLYQYHEGDFPRSVVEAEAAVKLVQYDAFSRR